MSSKFAPIIDQAYKVFEGINFSECNDCSTCCYFPWILKEEYNPHLENFGKTVKEIDSVAFIMYYNACKYARDNRCNLYEDRPLDCRLFPLDIIEEDGKYFWSLFTICPKHEELEDKLLPLIPKLEELITPAIFDQYKKQISLTKTLYLPYKLKQYKKIREVQNL